MLVCEDKKSVASITASLLSEFEKRKWPEEFEGFATREERKANTKAKQIVQLVRKGEFDRIEFLAKEAFDLDDGRWKLFYQYACKLCNMVQI